jgi:hypothetical protein
MSEFTGLIESILKEIDFGDIKNRQQSIVKLFPSFRDRVKNVNNFNGSKAGAHLIKKERDLWTFSVGSGTTKDLIYTDRVFFDKVDWAIKQAATMRGNWTNDGKHLNLTKVGQFVLMHADLGLSCNCPASLYWGPNYQRTRVGAELDHDEVRPAKIRNPHEYGINCKHLQSVMDALPFYGNDMAQELKKYYSDFILKVEKQMLKKQFNAPDKEEPVEQPKPEINPEKEKPEEFAQQEIEPEEEEENPEEKVGL